LSIIAKIILSLSLFWLSLLSLSVVQKETSNSMNFSIRAVHLQSKLSLTEGPASSALSLLFAFSVRSSAGTTAGRFISMWDDLVRAKDEEEVY